MAYSDGNPVGVARGVVGSAVDALIRWLPLAIVVALWAFASGRIVSTTFLPPPVAVFTEAAARTTNPEFLWDLTVSLYRVAIGLGLAILIGVTVGVSMAWSDTIEDLIDVPLTITYPIPKSALVPLSILWFGSGTQTVLFVIFLGSILPVVLNSYNAADKVDENLIRSARMMGTSDRDLLRNVIYPASIPAIFTGIRQAIPISFIVLINGELLAADVGIGASILSFGQLGLYEPMFAIIILFSIVAYVAVRLFERIRDRVLVWH